MVQDGGITITKSSYRDRLELVPQIMGQLEGRQLDILHEQAERLIRWLYDPDPTLGWVAGNRAPKPIREESINWGDLHVVDVERLGESGFLVTIEEAAPDCSEFQCWMRDRLAEWGWEVEVRTEW